jgi:uncharacterized membrane protein
VIIINKLIRRVIKSSESFADTASDWFGHPLFLIINLFFWTYWLTAEPEPFPYGALTLVVSLEAIVMSSLILNASRRKGAADTEMIREDIILAEDLNEKIDVMQGDLLDLHGDVEEIRAILDPGDDGR